MADETRSVDVVLGTTDKMSPGLSRGLQNMQRFGKGMMVAGGAVTAALGAIVMKTATMGDEIAKAGRRLGVTSEQLSTLRYAAERSGASFGNLEAALRRAQRSASDVDRGLKTAKDAWDTVGVSVKDASGQLKSADQLLREAADGMSKLESDTQRAAVAQEIFGRAGTMLLPMMEEGAAGIEKLQERARKLGLELDTNATEKAEEFVDAVADLKDASTGLVRVVGEELIPGLSDIALKTSDVIGKWKLWADAHPKLAGPLVQTFATGMPLLLGLGALLVILPKIAAGWKLVTTWATAAKLAMYGELLIPLAVLGWGSWEAAKGWEEAKESVRGTQEATARANERLRRGIRKPIEREGWVGGLVTESEKRRAAGYELRLKPGLRGQLPNPWMYEWVKVDVYLDGEQLNSRIDKRFTGAMRSATH